MASVTSSYHSPSPPMQQLPLVSKHSFYHHNIVFLDSISVTKPQHIIDSKCMYICHVHTHHIYIHVCVLHLHIADVDFVSSVPSVQFQTYQQLQFVPIRIIDDQIVEGDEYFNVSLQSSSLMRGVLLNPDPTHVTILENDCE